MTNSTDWSEYNPQKYEKKWQTLWERSELHLTPQTGDKPKFYCLDFFPYPSGYGLHVGHCRNYVPTDVISRYMRMKAYNVLHPFGWDAFGEPTEQFAIAHGVHPNESTQKNTAYSRRQLKMIGNGYDWSREIWSSNPDYYRWTQWFFLLLYKRGLAYRDTNWQWWCPTCQTTLSSHEAVGGECWRGHPNVTRREIPAWYFKITEYAERLLSGLDRIDWPESIKTMQRNWIGRSEGVQILFPIEGRRHIDGDRQLTNHISTFTTRPDTIFGVTFLALSPEHPFVGEITTENQRVEIDSYIKNTSKLSEIERINESRPKTGVFTGSYAVHPLNGKPVPIWIADYVLPGYGGGAVMGVPAHDQRDLDFAIQYKVPVIPVISNAENTIELDNQAYTGEGVLINSGRFDGFDSLVGAERISDLLQEKGFGEKQVQFRMRDWLISRQRYWGTPIPIIHCEKCGEVPVPEDQLPVLLPEMDDFQPDGSGRSPLARVEEFVNTTCPTCGGPAQRETDTMGGFACSSWYFLRFADPSFNSGPFNPQAVKNWLPVDLYVGGAEHAVLHLLYARFWIMVMRDAGLVDFDEPFTKLLNQGQLMGTDGQRMSKSKGNMVVPDSIVEQYGADSLRVHVMFMAPFDQDVNWTIEGISGAQRFLRRMWNLFAETYDESRNFSVVDPQLERSIHQVVQKITDRIEEFRLNTMVSTLMEFVNELASLKQHNTWRTRTFHQALHTLMLLAAPAIPHLAEELWSRTGHLNSIHQAAWPTWDPARIEEEQVQVVVQINGKLRDVITVDRQITKEGILAKVEALPKIQAFFDLHKPLRTIYIPGKIVNFVVQDH